MCENRFRHWPNRALYFVQWALKEQHSHQTFGQWPVAPTTSIVIGWPSWPAIERARPCECHGTITHLTAAAVGVCWCHPRPEHLRLALCHKWCRTCDSPTHYWDFWFLVESARVGLGADAGCIVLSWGHSKSTRASWCVTNTDSKTITPLRRFRLNLFLRLSARHTTRTRRDPRRAPRPRHAHRPPAAPAGQHARSRARWIFFRVVVCVVSPVVRSGRSGITPNAAPTSRKSGTRSLRLGKV